MIITEMHLVCDACRRSEISGDADCGRAEFHRQAKQEGWERRRKGGRLLDICHNCITSAVKSCNRCVHTGDRRLRRLPCRVCCEFSHFKAEITPKGD